MGRAGAGVQDQAQLQGHEDKAAAAVSMLTGPATEELLSDRASRLLTAQRSAGNRAVAARINASRVQRSPNDAMQAPAPAPTTWMGRDVDSDLPRDAEGKVEEPRFAIGRGIPKVDSKDVETDDAKLKGGVGVGTMFTPIKRGVMRPVAKPGAGTSESVVMIDTTTGRKYLFKPLGGEPTVDYAEARGVTSGHFAERARAGAISAGELGLATPDVRLVEINGRKGSLTAWVEPTAGGEVMSLEKFAKRDPQKFSELQKQPQFVQALSGIQALDYLINNVDRVNNLGNYMIELGRDGKFKALIPIDQELSFTRTTDRAIIAGRTSLMPQQWTKSLADKVAQLHADPSALITQLRPLVGDAAVAGVVARLEQLHDDGVRRGFIPPTPGVPGAPGGPRPGGGPGSGGGRARGAPQPPLVPGGETPVADDAPLGAGGKAGSTAPPLARGGKTAGTGPGTGTGQAQAPDAEDPGTSQPAAPKPRTPRSSSTPPPGSSPPWPGSPTPTGITAPQPGTAAPRPPGVLGEVHDVPDTSKTAQDLGIVPGSDQDTARFRANRAEQQRLAAIHASDAVSVQGGKQPGGEESPGTTPDPRARARAADYASIYSDWDRLGPDGRKARIENIMNAHLAREGIPPVKAIYAGKEPGNAEFAPDLWAIALSGKVVNGSKPTIAQFATLVDNAVHETAHAVTTYRGIRVALADKAFDPKALVRDDIVQSARAANDRRLPSAEFNEHAIGEAREIYRLQVDPNRSTQVQVPAGAVSRVAVIDEKEEAERVYFAAKKAHDDAKKQLDDHPNDADVRKKAVEAHQAAVAAQNRFNTAHNAYMALPEEGPSWRAGSAVKAAITERLTLEQDLENARQRAAAAVAQEKTLRERREVVGSRVAKRRAGEELALVNQLQARVDQLNHFEARAVAGQSMFREKPLSQGEIDRAPRPQPIHDDVGEGGPKTTAGPKATKSTPAPALDAAGPTGAPRGAQRPAPQPGTTAKPPPIPPARIAPKPPPTPVGPAKADAPAGPATPAPDPAHAEPGKPADAGTEQKPPAPKVAVKPGFNLQEGFTVATKTPQAPAGEGAKPGTQADVKAYVNPNQIGGQVGAMQPTGGGGKHGPTAGATYDIKTGDTTTTTGYKGQTKGGHSANFGLTSGNSVRAEEPEEISEGVWEVRFTWTDSDGIAAGLSGKMPGGMELSIGGSDTDSKTKTGSKRFTTEKKALEFKRNVREELGKEIAAAKFLPPLNTVAGALRIPEGETRGFGATNTKSGNIAAGFATGGLGKSGFMTSGMSVDIHRVAGTTVRVTVMVTTGKGSAWTASGLGLTNESGGSESGAVGVTYEFNLAKKDEGAAYERYVVFPLPAPAGKMPFSTRRLSSSEEHDNYALLWGTAGFGGEVSEDITNDAQGEHAKFTGAQTEDVNPGLIMGLFDDEKHARAEIVSSAENGKAVGFAAKFSVSGESGEFNRKQFGKIFMGAQFSGVAKASGKWNLTAAIPKEAVKQLQEVSGEFKNAKTTYEKLRIYSQLVKKNGAQMLGGQVGITSLAWNLELKGDSNFPGEKGRAKLNNQRQELLGRLKAKPDDAFAIAREAKDTLDALDVRYKNVKDETKYTDLPDGLRKEQLEVIRGHMREFIFVRQRALTVGGQYNPNESLGDVEKRAYSKDGYNQIATNERERVQLQDGIRLANRDVIQRFNQVYNASLGIKSVMPSWGVFSFAADADPTSLSSITSSAMDDIKAAFDYERQQLALESQVKILWEKWDRVPDADPVLRLEAMKQLLPKLRERRMALDQQLERLRSAGKTLYFVVPFALKQKRPKFWISVSEAREEVPEPTPMALERR